MELLAIKTVAEIVSTNYKTADIFKRYGIDFCCGGNVNVADICSRKSIDISKLENDLDEISSRSDGTDDYNRWKLDFLVDYVINVHHTYVLENIPVISEYLAEVVSAHGESHREVVEIQTFFQMVADELLHHMQKEEKILFPFIKRMVDAQNGVSTFHEFEPGSIHGPISMMELEHESAGNIFRTISSLSDNYTVPSDACNSYKVLYAKLEEFEKDLHKHVHLENNIMFPKALKTARLFREEAPSRESL